MEKAEEDKHKHYEQPDDNPHPPQPQKEGRKEGKALSSIKILNQSKERESGKQLYI